MRRWALAWAAVVGSGIVAIGFLELVWKDPPQKVKLLDGSWLTLESVTCGRRLVISVNRWQRLLANLPKPFADKLRLKRPAIFTNNVASLGLGFRWSNPNITPLDLAYFLVDENGVEAAMDGFIYFGGPSPSGTMLNRGATAFPRRGKTIGVRLYRRNQSFDMERFAEFKIQNPIARSYPVWTGSELPISESNGDCTFTFKEFLTRAGSMPSTYWAAKPGENWTQMYFRVSQKGEVSDQWQPVRVELSDATGNHAASDSMFGVDYSKSSPLRSHEQVFVMDRSLWPDGSAWKCRVEFSRKDTAQFRADELWTIRGMKNPTDDGRNEINATNRIQGVEVRFRGLVGKQGQLRSYFPMFRSTSNIEIEVPDLPHGVRLNLVRVKDDHGREVKCQPLAYGAGRYAFGIEFPNNAETVDVTLAIHKSRFVGYLAKPVVLTTEANPSR